jgi:hypothetical protein
MNTENTLVHDETETLDNSDSPLSFDDWFEQLTPSTRAALIKERDYQLETSARLFPQLVPSTDTLAFLRVIERRLAELDMRLQHQQAGEGKPEQEWFSIDEVAALTGLSSDHVRRHVTGGTLPVCNQGTFEKPYYRIRRRDIDA